MVGDAALVERARAGDKAAFGELLGRHRPLLLALCRRFVGDAGLAEDAAQEAALQALLALDRLRRADRFGPWLAGIGLNVCRRLLRDRAAAPPSWDELYGGRLAAEPVGTEPDPAELAAELDLAARVRAAVDCLPLGQRAAVLLFYLAGLTHAEVAAALGIEVGAVKTRLLKARARLRRELHALWMEETMAEQMVEMRVADVVRSPATDDTGPRHFVVLEEVGGPRRLPIWIGRSEAEGLAEHTEGIAFPRPQTYAFTASLLQAAGARVREVRINRLAETVFYAEVALEGGAAVDARPSDALNLAVRAGAPIRVDPDVLEAGGKEQIPAGERVLGADA